MKALERFESRVDMFQARLVKFKQRLAEDPSYAFSWADDAFEAAAQLQVSLSIVNELKDGREVKLLSEYILSMITGKSKRVASSSSACSNLMDQYTLAAYADAYDIFRYMK